MAFNIATFSSEISRVGVQRTNLFEVTFSVPPALLNNNVAGLTGFTNSARLINLYCEECPLPGVGIKTNDILRYGYGVTEKKPFGAQYTEVPLLFRADGNMDVYAFMNAWMQSITCHTPAMFGMTSQIGASPNQHAFELAYKLDYAQDVTITTFKQALGLSSSPANVGDLAPQVSSKIILREAYPILVDKVQFGWADGNKYAQIPVVFTYFDWYDASRQLPIAQSNLGSGSTPA